MFISLLKRLQDLLTYFRYNGLMKKIGISKCLLGENVRYDGSNRYNQTIVDLIKNEEIIPICPEAMVFDIPHMPLEISGNCVIMADNSDVTKTLHQASNLALQELLDCDFVILKQKSPSCGYGLIYDGSFSGKLIKGNGVLTNLLIENKIKVYSDEQIEDIKEELKK